jgi:hypothetical protein
VSPGDPTPHLERLPGVLAATLFLDTPAPPRVYVATTADTDADALRAIIVGLLHDHGFHAPADNIHIATAPRRPAAGTVLPRVSLDAVDVNRGDNRADCTVRLRSGDRLAAGTATEPDTRNGRARAAARATLDAAESLDPDFRFGLEGLRTVDLFGHQAVILLVDATAGRSQTRLPGTALLNRSVEEAAALAALHALRAWSA